jgi:hypothetical protein
MSKLREYERLKKRILELATEKGREEYLVELGKGDPAKLNDLQRRYDYNMSEIKKLYVEMSKEERDSLDI